MSEARGGRDVARSSWAWRAVAAAVRSGASGGCACGAPPVVAPEAVRARCWRWHGIRHRRGGAVGRRRRESKKPAPIRLFKGHASEIWLIHKPDSTRVVQQQTVRFSALKPFVFPPEEVPAAARSRSHHAGSLQLVVPASVLQLLVGLWREGHRTFARTDPPPLQATCPRRRAAPGGAPDAALHASIARHARRTTPFVDTHGATDMSLEMPKRETSCPSSCPRSARRFAQEHTFSIRVRIVRSSKVRHGCCHARRYPSLPVIPRRHLSYDEALWRARLM